MAASLLLRPATTVIATVRDPAHELSKSLSDLPASEGSKIIVSVFDAKKGPDALLAALADAGIQHLNLVISNAGNSDAFRSVLETDPSALRDDFEVNAVGPFRLFQGCWPLLSKAETGSDKKFVLITSSVGSIAGMEEESFPGVAYGASKAAANWLAKKIGTELASEGLQVGIIHPG
jgi:norsolorinic acid ketoreductase